LWNYFNYIQNDIQIHLCGKCLQNFPHFSLHTNLFTNWSTQFKIHCFCINKGRGAVNWIPGQIYCTWYHLPEIKPALYSTRPIGIALTRSFWQTAFSTLDTFCKSFLDYQTLLALKKILIIDCKWIDTFFNTQKTLSIIFTLHFWPNSILITQINIWTHWTQFTNSVLRAANINWTLQRRLDTHRFPLQQFITP